MAHKLLDAAQARAGGGSTATSSSLTFVGVKSKHGERVTDDTTTTDESAA